MGSCLVHALSSRFVSIPAGAERVRFSVVYA
jgi:hypothetical protein